MIEATPSHTVTVEEAAQMIGISRTSAYQAARTGELPTIRIGRRLLVPRHALARMLYLEDEEGGQAAVAGQKNRQRDR